MDKLKYGNNVCKNDHLFGRGLLGQKYFATDVMKHDEKKFEFLQNLSTTFLYCNLAIRELGKFLFEVLKLPLLPSYDCALL